VLSLVVLARRHELFLSGKELEKDKDKDKDKDKGGEENDGRAPQVGNKKSDEVLVGARVAAQGEREGGKASTRAKKETVIVQRLKYPSFASFPRLPLFQPQFPPVHAAPRTSENFPSTVEARKEAA
jgi:hypothetical protein